MPPFLIAGLVLVLFRFAGTLQKFGYEKLQGVKDVRRLRDELAAARFDDPDLEAQRQDALGQLQFLIGFWDIAIGQSYDPTTNKGRIEMAADFAGLGFKFSALRLGIPLASRVIGALGTRFAVGEGLTLATNVGSIVDIFTGKSTSKTFGEISEAIIRTQELLETGKRAGEPFLPFIEVATANAFDTADLAVSVATFQAAPSITGGVELVKKGLVVVEGWIALFNALIALAPELPGVDVEPEVKKFFRGTAGRGEAFAKRATRASLPTVQAKRAREPFEGFAAPLADISGFESIGPTLTFPPTGIPTDVVVPPFFPPIVGPGGILLPPGGVVVPPGGTQQLIEFLEAAGATIAGGLSFSRRGISDLLAIIQELKKG